MTSATGVRAPPILPLFSGLDIESPGYRRRILRDVLETFTAEARYYEDLVRERVDELAALDADPDEPWADDQRVAAYREMVRSRNAAAEARARARKLSAEIEAEELHEKESKQMRAEAVRQMVESGMIRIASPPFEPSTDYRGNTEGPLDAIVWGGSFSRG